MNLPAMPPLPPRTTGLLLTAMLLAAGRTAAEPMDRQVDDLMVRVEEGAGEPASIGSYAIRIYAVTDMDHPFDQFLTGRIEKRDGSVESVWALNQGTPEKLHVYVVIRNAGSGGYADLARFRLDGDVLNPAPLPRPPEALMDGYMGHDIYALEQGVLYLSFPRYREGDANAAPTGGKTRLRFDLANETWMAAPPAD